MLNILVCIKQVPDGTAVTLDQNHSLIRDSVAQIMNPADESALECALSLKDELGAGVTVLTMGKPSAEGMLRDAVARGADHMILVTDPAFSGADTLATAKTLKAAIQKNPPFDLILCGRRTVDGETGQVGPALAALLDMPVVVNATSLALRNGESAAVCVQLTEHGSLEWRANRLPLLAAFCEWSFPLRLPTLLGMRNAKTAPLTCWDREALGLEAFECGLKGSPTRVIRVHTKPAGLRHCAFVSVPELLKKELF